MTVPGPSRGRKKICYIKLLRTLSAGPSQRHPVSYRAAMNSPLPISEQTALVTGSSSGIGLNLAREFARHGHPVVLVAPIEEEIEAIADQLSSEFGVPVKAIAADLTDELSIDDILSELEDDGTDIEILCNNAGLGHRGKFWEVPLEDQIEIIRLNIEAVTRLTHAFLPRMIERGHGRILNTASIAGFEPGPLMAVYHASKAYVLSLSEALATELKDTGVTLTALCPGPVDTDFFPKAEMLDSNAFQKGNVMAPQEIAEAAYPAVMSGERVIVPGGINKALVFSRRFMSESMQARMNEKLYETNDGERKRERGDVEAAKASPED